MAEPTRRERRVGTALAVSITLLVAAVVILFAGSLLPPDLEIWGYLVPAALVLASTVVFAATLIGLRRRRGNE